MARVSSSEALGTRSTRRPFGVRLYLAMAFAAVALIAAGLTYVLASGSSDSAAEHSSSEIAVGRTVRLADTLGAAPPGRAATIVERHASENSQLIIRVYPVNLLGFKTPFGETNARFDIEQGANLVEIRDVSAGVVNVRSKGIEGEAIIGVYSLKSGVLIQKLLIKILPRDLT